MEPELKERYRDLFKNYLDDRSVQKLLTRLDRICFKIAPLNVHTGNTQTISRWEVDPSSPHFATKESCTEIFEALSKDLLGYFNAPGYSPRRSPEGNESGTLTVDDIKSILSHSSRIGSLELPITYDSFDATPIHVSSNIYWYKISQHRHDLEQWLNNKPILTKIQVKAFLTDRRQTGEYMTNREVRWETHPRSPQFATRLDCSEIADKLVAQIATFTNAPEVPSELIPLVEKSLGENYVKNSFRCPISGKPILYDEFVSRVASPVHGRSGYQVGHLNPLASTGGHNPQNISWITDLGNRVQGDSSLDNIVDDIFYMATFHKQRLGKDWSEVEDFFS